jgi:hypothetical protein
MLHNGDLSLLAGFTIEAAISRLVAERDDSGATQLLFGVGLGAGAPLILIGGHNVF